MRERKIMFQKGREEKTHTHKKKQTSDVKFFFKKKMHLEVIKHQRIFFKNSHLPTLPGFQSSLQVSSRTADNAYKVQYSAVNNEHHMSSLNPIQKGSELQIQCTSHQSPSFLIIACKFLKQLTGRAEKSK